MKKHLILFLLAVGLRNSASGDALPVGRGSAWKGYVGVEGGIPNSSNMTVYATVTPGQGAAAVTSAITSCPSNQVVQLSAGNFTLGTVDIHNNGVVVRGAGPGQTVVNLTGGFYVSSPDNATYKIVTGGTPSGYTSVSWNGGLTAGSSNIVVGSTSGLSVSQIINLDQLNAGDVTANIEQSCGYCGRGNNRSQVQRCRVTAISGNTVTIDCPILMSNWNATLSPQCWWYTMNDYVQRVGIENMTILGNGGVGGYSANICLQDTANCWIKNVYSTNCTTSHFNHYGGYRCEIRHCEMRWTRSQAALSYGYLTLMASRDWFEDNIMWGIPGGYIEGWASSQDVASYNFGTNSQYNVNTGWFMPTLWTHDAYSHMDLLEGNACGGVRHDIIHGTGGWEMNLRNRYTGFEPGRYGASYPISAYAYHWNMVFVGNILGTIGVHDAGHYPNYIASNIQAANNTPAIYLLGWEDYVGTNDPVTLSSAWIHGNYDTVNASVVWQASNPDHNIPNSLLYDSKPAWFGDRPWPPYDPANGAALAANLMCHTNIPAGYRYVFGADPPGGGGGGGQTNPVASVTPSAIIFGTNLAMVVGGAITNSFTVQNIGAGTLIGTGVVSAPFYVVSNAVYSLASNASKTIGFYYSPTGAAFNSDSVTWTDNSGTITSSVSGIGCVTQPFPSFEATNGTFASPFVSSNNYLVQHIGTDLPAGGTAYYCFYITNEGVYTLSDVIKAPSSTNAAVYVNFDARPFWPSNVWDMPVSASPSNAVVSWRGTGTRAAPQYNPVKVYFSCGCHQMVVRGYVAEAQIGKFTFAMEPASTQDAQPPSNLRVFATP